MKINTRRLITVAGPIAIAGLVIYMVTRLDAQSTAAPVDFTNAATAEVHDAQGQLLLRGQFAVADDQSDDDIERKAALQPAGTDADATGEAEVEYAKNAPKHQEVEFKVQQLESGSSVTFLIDGRVVGRSSVDDRGRAELDLEVPIPGAR